MLKYTFTINNAVKGLAAMTIIAGLAGCQNTQSAAVADKQDS